MPVVNVATLLGLFVCHMSVCRRTNEHRNPHICETLGDYVVVSANVALRLWHAPVQVSVHARVT